MQRLLNYYFIFYFLLTISTQRNFSVKINNCKAYSLLHENIAIRNNFFRSIYLSAFSQFALSPLKVIAEDRPVDFISNRFKNKEINRLHPGLANNDLYFPDWFEGKWSVSSYLKDVEAPLGIELFGGEKAYIKAKNEITTSLEYISKFNRLSNGKIIADRLYNVEQIAIAAMGKESIIDDYQLNSNTAQSIRLVLASPSSKNIQFEVALETTDRQQIPLANDPKLPTYPYFSVMEVSTESIKASNITSNYISPIYKKDIETITLYIRASSDKIKAIQRTATYLCPSDLRYSSLIKSQPRAVVDPIDVRCYDVVYNRII